MSPSKVLVQISGSIAAYKACALVSRLVQAGHEVQVVATPDALRFVGAASFEGLTGKPVLSDTFQSGGMMDHIHLNRWADLTILAPASANTINKLAAGIADTLVGAIFLARDPAKPFLLAPAMNTKMYRHPATQASLEKLRLWGVEVLETASGVLACGDEGEGKLLDPELVFAAIQQRLAPPASGEKLRVLVTSGGTREPIDGVRFITNGSSGATGARIAEHFSARGHEVTYLHAEGAVQPACAPARAVSFMSFADLDRAMREELHERSYDAVIHLAAVSDFSVGEIESGGKRLPASDAGKLDSGEAVTLHLKRNHKIVDRVREYARDPKLALIAFKLTHGADEQTRRSKVDALLRGSQADFVVQNDATEISGARHLARIHDRERVVAECASKGELAVSLEKLILDKKGQRS